MFKSILKNVAVMDKLRMKEKIIPRKKANEVKSNKNKLGKRYSRDNEK